MKSLISICKRKKIGFVEIKESERGKIKFVGPSRLTRTSKEHEKEVKTKEIQSSTEEYQEEEEKIQERTR